ncbi:MULTISPECIES: DUF402 domain-containing protein [unclassified Fusibacter]|uniref:DUF402 domain-containing protein n=1 Tax=unclassified Fusibacter TaxID=2624464 RepID=UPI0013E957AE|nr:MULTISPECIES: DUF402 domain-containing protein [unclassified Fusibacter]MCK8058166.1 DUF402 domain-containing protein [Fusibacter sp. A2]NPE20749.1 DUF402 domain-containing protein [Fusibacter sp. A1]
MDKKSIQVQSYKHDGKLHYEWGSNIYKEDHEKVILIGLPGRVLNHHTKGRDFILNSVCVEVFYFKEYFNCFFNLNEEGGLEYYVNIGLPIEYENKIITYIDLDVDLEKSADGSWKVVDEDEFLVNQRLYGYSDELVKKVESTRDELLRRIECSEYPFDGTYEKMLINYCEKELDNSMCQMVSTSQRHAFGIKWNLF